MTVPFSDVVFAYDFDRLTADGRLFDHGPHGLHATAGAAGAAPTRQLDGSYRFDGGDYFTLPLDFYRWAPTGERTILSVSSLQTAVAGGYDLFGAAAFIGGNFYGFSHLRTVAGASLVYNFIGNGTLPYCGVAAGGAILKTYDTQVTCAVVTTTPRWMTQQTGLTATWGVGAYAPCVYSAVTQPTIGIGLNGYWIGRIYYLALIRGALSSPDLSQLCSLISDGSKPWCDRR